MRRTTLLLLASGMGLGFTADAAPVERVAVDGAPSITLEKAIQIALENNAELFTARTALDQARALILSAKARPNPEFDAEAGSTLSVDDLSLTIGIEKPISIRGKIAKRVDLATTELERDEWFVRDLERFIAAGVRGSYRTAQVLDQRMQLADSLADLNQRLLTVARARFERGEVSELDVRQFEIELARRGQEVESLSTLRQSALIELSRLLNVPPDEGLALSVALAGETQPFPVEPFLEAAAGRPDLKGLEKEAAAAEKEIILRKAEIRENPRVGLFYNFARDEFTHPSTTALTSQTDHVIGARVTIPIPFRYKNQGEIAHAEARARTARASSRAQLLNIDRQVRDAHQRAMAQLKIVDALKQGVDAAEAGRKLAEQAYGQGLINAVQLIQTQQQFFDIRDARLDAAEAYYAALSDLEGAVNASVERILGESHGEQWP